MLQDIDPLSVGILFQNRYRIVRCIKGGPPNAVYDVVDEKTSACCLLEVVASGSVTIDDIGVHSEIESRVGRLFEDEQNINIFEPGMDAETGQPYLALEPFADVSIDTNPDVGDGFDIDIPVYIEEPSPAFLAPLPIPLPPIPPQLGTTRPALPPPPPLRAQSSPSILPSPAAISWPPPNPLFTSQSRPRLLPPLNPPPHFPSLDGETTLVGIQQLPPPLDLIASLPHRYESSLHRCVEPLVVAAAQVDVPPSSTPRSSLRGRFRRHRGVVITLAIGMGLVALGLLGLWTQRKQDASVEDSNRSKHAFETLNSEKAPPMPISTSTRDTALPLNVAPSATQTQRATRDTSTKTTEKAVRGPGRNPSTERKTKTARESLF